MLGYGLGGLGAGPIDVGKSGGLYLELITCLRMKRLVILRFRKCLAAE